MHERRCCAGNLVRFQQSAATDVCAPSEMLHRPDLRDSLFMLGMGNSVWSGLFSDYLRTVLVSTTIQCV